MVKIILHNKVSLFKLNKKVLINQNITKELVRGNKNEDTYQEIRNN